MDNKDAMELRGIKKGEQLAIYRCSFDRCPYRELEKLTNYEAYCQRIERVESGGVMQLIRALIGSEP